MSVRARIVLTGGPCGGKSALIDDLAADAAFAGRFVALPEAIFTMRMAGISSREKLFQQAMVQRQIELEEEADRALGWDDRRIVICHRGSLDPIAYWRQRGWPSCGFRSFSPTDSTGFRPLIPPRIRPPVPWVFARHRRSSPAVA